MREIKDGKPRYVAAWLLACAALVLTMIVVGAITRLTESGLSMVEWRPLIGAIPPLSEEEWQRVFNLYQQTPEYQQKNFWMSIAEFRTIFFWEWFHRVLGRLIGLIYALPFLIFWIKGWIPKGYLLPLTGLLFLGGTQGFMGWYMVQSGLVDMPAVSHYRLAAHLSLAFTIFGLLVWYALKLLNHYQYKQVILANHTRAVMAIIGITIVWGAFVAGLDAGLVYNEFPHMGASIVPMSDWQPNDGLTNLHNNHAFVQFTHRWLGILSFLAVISLWVHAFFRNYNSIRMHCLAVMVFIQVGLGIATLLSQVNIILAVFHQLGAAILIGLLVANLYRFTRPKA